MWANCVHVRHRSQAAPSNAFFVGIDRSNYAQIAYTRPDFTPQFIQLLQSKHVKATFFLIGLHASEHPDMVKRIAREGLPELVRSESVAA